MEWCATLCGEFGLTERFARIGRTGIVLLMFGMIMAKCYDAGQSGLNMNAAFPAEENVTVRSTTIERATVGSVTVEPAVKVKECLEEFTSAVSLSEVTAAVPMIPDILVPVVPDEPKAMRPSVPDEPEVIIPSIPDVPDVSVPPVSDSTEEPGDTVLPATEGFLIDESGMICKVTDTLVITDGCLALPSEGCTGVAPGAFADAPGGICEIYIPSNITYIAEGAFSGLYELEWFETDGSGAYYTEDGVLLSDGGTCILSFPSGRIGSYKVPADVTRFAYGAFADAHIDTLDATECVITDAGDLPGTILLMQK